MPNSVRWDMKRKIDQAVGNLETCERYILELAEIYNEYHPEYSVAFLAISEALTPLREMLREIREEI